MLDIKPVAGALGAEIHGLDLSQELNNENSLRIRKLLNEYEVIFFRNQDISSARQKALASSFGPLQTHPAYATVEGFPEITILESTPDKPTMIEAWHTDMTFREHPPMGTVLKAVTIPPRGGDTLWSSMTAAYNGLSFHMQRFLEDLSAVHLRRRLFGRNLVLRATGLTIFAAVPGAERERLTLKVRRSDRADAERMAWTLQTTIQNRNLPEPRRQ